MVFYSLLFCMCIILVNKLNLSGNLAFLNYVQCLKTCVILILKFNFIYIYLVFPIQMN